MNSNTFYMVEKYSDSSGWNRGITEYYLIKSLLLLCLLSIILIIHSSLLYLAIFHPFLAISLIFIFPLLLLSVGCIGLYRQKYIKENPRRGYIFAISQIFLSWAFLSTSGGNSATNGAIGSIPNIFWDFSYISIMGIPIVNIQEIVIGLSISGASYNIFQSGTGLTMGYLFLIVYLWNNPSLNSLLDMIITS